MAKKILKIAGGFAFGLPGLIAGSVIGKSKKKTPVAGPPVVGANESAAAVTARQEEEKRRRTAMAARSIPMTGSIITPGSTLGG